MWQVLCAARTLDSFFVLEPQASPQASVQLVKMTVVRTSHALPLDPFTASKTRWNLPETCGPPSQPSLFTIHLAAASRARMHACRQAGWLGCSRSWLYYGYHRRGLERTLRGPQRVNNFPLAWCNAVVLAFQPKKYAVGSNPRRSSAARAEQGGVTQQVDVFSPG